MVKYFYIIKKYQNKIDWLLISKYQQLSESFIEKYQDKIYQDKLNKIGLSETDIPLTVIHNCDNNKVIRILPDNPKQIEEKYKLNIVIILLSKLKGSKKCYK